MRKFTLLKTMLLLVAFVAGCGNVWGETVTYTISSKNTLSTTGTAPTGSSATIAETYGTSKQMTGGNSQTLTLKGYNGCTISNITLSMKSNASKGAGTLSYSTDGGSTYTYIVGSNSNGVNFDDAKWNGNYTQTYTNVSKDVTIEATASDLIIKIAATVNSLYCQSYTLTYAASSDPSLNASDVDIANDATSGEISYTLINPVDGAEVSASSDDEWISNITVDEGTQKVTFSTTANTVATKRSGTITLSYTKSGEELATKAVSVTQAKAVVMRKYTLATQIIPGKHYIITNETDGNIKAMGQQNDNNRAAVAITVSNGKASVESDADVYEFVIGGDETTGYYTIYDEVNEGYLYAASSSKNYLRNQKDIDDNARWSITFDNNGVATIKAEESENRNLMQYNSSSSLFSCYANDQAPIYLFMRDGDESTQEVTATIANACTDGKGKYYGTYSNVFPFIVPADVTVSEISVVDGELLIENYETGDVVPANTGVMLSATSAGNKALTLSVGGTSALGSDNMLRPTGDAGITDTDMNESDTKFYRLTMHNDTDLGFWWGAEDGAAFDYETPNRAYLAVPNTAAAKSGFLLFDETTGIESLPQATSLKGETEWYNLAGQRVAQPTRGLYIVGGKKVSVK